MNGVSLIICCHNSEDKLPQTLRHVNELAVSSDIPWELIIIDNASSDRTSEVAAQLISVDIKRLSKIVREDALGLRNARLRGISESKYDLISFIDDDNWVCSDWINRVHAVMSAHPEAGACGGKGYPRFEVEPPPWFEQYQACYAVGPQGEVSGFVDERGYLCGAGLTIRRSAWNQIVQNGFSLTLSGRHGSNLAAGEDSEICLALLCYGWRLWYDEKLTYYHYLPEFRLKWEYLINLHRGFGASEAVLGIYRKILKSDYKNKHSFENAWIYESVAILNLLNNVSIDEKPTYDKSIIEWSTLYGYLSAIVENNIEYDKLSEYISEFYKKSPKYSVNNALNYVSVQMCPFCQHKSEINPNISTELTNRLAQIQSSLSWRITKPLRWMGDKVRGIVSHISKK